MSELVEYHKDKIWLKEYPIKYAGTKFNARMTIVRMNNDDLLVHSPCEIDEKVRGQLSNLGSVAYIAAPGYYHYFHIVSAQQAFPEAETFICPGLERKLPNLKFDWILGDRPDPRWAVDFDQVLVRGNKYIWETALFHKPTRILLLVDLIENFTSKTKGVNWALKLWWKVVFRMWENPKPAPEYQFGWKDTQAARHSLMRIMQWDFDKIIIAHGDLIEQRAKETAKRAWKRILGA